MSSWTNDVDDSEESGDEESQEVSFRMEFAEKVAAEDAGEISEIDLMEGIDEVEDEDILRRGWLLLDGERQRIIENRIEDLTGIRPGEESDDEESDDSNSWGGTPIDETDEEESSDSAIDSKAPEPSIESAEEIEAEEQGGEEESPENQSSGISEQSGAPPSSSNGLSIDEVTSGDRRWKIMVWGPPKMFKTHFAFTMPEPIAFIDCEGKVGDLARKFPDTEVRIWQPKSMSAEPDTKFRRAKKALDEALEYLDWYRRNEGEIGTIVVDSMSLMWEWAQFHHKIENFPLKDPESIELSSNFNSSQESDWAIIKEYHNGEFREKITDSPYHFYWTAMEREAFSETLEDEDNRQFYEPRGEPNNDYKVDTEIRARKDKDRGKVGDLIGSNYVDHSFIGLERPTFPRVRDAVRRIEDGERKSESRNQIAQDIGAETIIDYDPQVYVQQ